VTEPTIILLAILGSGAVSALIAGWLVRRKTKAGAKVDEAVAADRITGSSLSLVDRWEKRVMALEDETAALRVRVRLLEDTNEILYRGAMKLQGQVMALGHEPVWRVESLRPLPEADKRE
jgi:hypothetical protein